MQEYRFIDALTFLYHTFAHSTDGEISVAEEEKIVEKILGWKLIHNAAELRETIQRSHRWYLKALEEGNLHENIQETMDMLKMSELNEAVRVNVINDLMDIAMADGEVYETELKWIRSLAKNWDIEMNL